MKTKLLDFQEQYVFELQDNVSTAKTLLERKRNVAVTLSAPTGSGKTVMMAALIERTLLGADGFAPEKDAVFLWLSDQPELNEQSRRRIEQASGLPESLFTTIETSFDQKTFDPGHVYFVNTQKLGKDKNLVRKGGGDKREWTFWQTVENTARNNAACFYLVVDEAHRGMNQSKDQENASKTIVQKFLLGETRKDAEEGEVARDKITPVPLVIGVSATPERFQELVKGTNRVPLDVIVDPVKVRESGLLKDLLTVHAPKKSMPSDVSMLKSAAARWKSMAEEWETYCLSQAMQVVRPVLVIQVEDGENDDQGKEKTVSKTDLAEVLGAIEDTLGERVGDEDVVHCFNTDAAVKAGKRSIRRLDPSRVQDDDKAKFVLFKMALTTGWDCPRAEVMMSFRKAKDATYIAQLVGRMVRAPLARSIEGSETLNEAHLYLPHYDENNLKAIVDKLEGDKENVPATKIRRDGDVENLAVPAAFEDVRIFLNTLPSYAMRTGRVLSDIRRLTRLASLLVTDEVDLEAMKFARKGIVVALSDARENLLNTAPDFKTALSQSETVTLRSLRIDQKTLDIQEGPEESVDISEKNIDDIFRQAKQRLSDDFALAYAKARHDAEHPSKGKLELFLLLQRPDVIRKLEGVAKTAVSELRTRNQSGISQLKTSQRKRYNDLFALARMAEATTMEVPPKADFPATEGNGLLEKHLFQNKAGAFPTKLQAWEEASLALELPGAHAWVRNLDRKPWSLAFVYDSVENKGAVPGFPDLVVIRKNESGFVADVLEPHAPSLADAYAKATGLAKFADAHGAQFGRIEMQKVENGRIIGIDFNMNSDARQKALLLKNPKDLDALYDTCGVVRTKS